MTAHRIRPEHLSTGTLLPFFAFTFALTWGIAALVIAFFEPVTAVFGDLNWPNPLFILAVYSPGIVATVLVLRRAGGRGLRGFLGRLTLWRMPGAWWVFLVAGVPAAFYAGAILIGSVDAPVPFDTWSTALAALGAALLLGPIEELGWRGVALPLLQRRFAPLWAGLIVGLVWAIWHLPAFLISGTPQDGWSFVPYFVGVVSLSVVVTPMFNAARGSLLIPVLFHFQANNPMWPDAHPWDAVLFAAIAVVVVVVNRRTMLDGTRGAGDVVGPPPA
jgi:uncharacterized protein